jgi:hypothetical protein
MSAILKFLGKNLLYLLFCCLFVDAKSGLGDAFTIQRILCVVGTIIFQKPKVKQVYVKKYKRIEGNLRFNPKGYCKLIIYGE